MEKEENTPLSVISTVWTPKNIIQEAESIRREYKNYYRGEPDEKEQDVE